MTNRNPYFQWKTTIDIRENQYVTPDNRLSIFMANRIHYIQRLIYEKINMFLLATKKVLPNFYLKSHTDEKNVILQLSLSIIKSWHYQELAPVKASGQWKKTAI